MVVFVLQTVFRPFVYVKSAVQIFLIFRGIIHFQCEHARRRIRTCVLAFLLLLTPVYASAQLIVVARHHECPYLLGTLQIVILAGSGIQVGHIYAQPDVVVVETVALRSSVHIRSIRSRQTFVVVIFVESFQHHAVHHLQPLLIARSLIHGAHGRDRCRVSPKKGIRILSGLHRNQFLQQHLIVCCHVFFHYIKRLRRPIHKICVVSILRSSLRTSTPERCQHNYCQQYPAK